MRHFLFMVGVGCALVSSTIPSFAQSFSIQSAPADIARWMYPYNVSPANRSAASVFASFGSSGAYDTRDAQFLLAWNTSNSIPVNMGANNYLIRHVRVTLTIASGNQYIYTGTLRDYRTYFPTNDLRHITPTAASSPVELYGVGFRGGYTALTFPQDGPFSSSGSTEYTNRNAFAACFDTNGILVDVSNNVGDDGTNEIDGAFEAAPFAVGKTADAAEGQLMPAGSQLTFDLNLDDPLIYHYVQEGLNSGRLDLMVSSLISASYGGTPNYPNFYTVFNALADPDEYPLVDIEGAVVRTNLDADADGLPDDWEQFYCGQLGIGATGSYTGDGISNLAKYLAGTDPTSTNNFRLLSIQTQPAANELRFTFAPGRDYSIQWSDDLQHWQTVTNPSLLYLSDWLTKMGTDVAYPSPIYAEWHDTNNISEQRFYRISAQ